MSYGVFEAAVAEDLGKTSEVNERARKLEAAVYDVDSRFGQFLRQAQDEEEFRDRVSLCKKDILKVVGEHLPPVTGVMRRVISAQRSMWKKRACGEVVWGYGDSPTESVAYPDEDTTLKVCPKDGDDQLWEWSSEGGGHSGSGVTNSPDKARQDAEDCYKFGSKTASDGSVQPPLDTDITFQPEDGVLIPEDNFEGYKDSVDQGAEQKIQHNFEASNILEDEDAESNRLQKVLDRATKKIDDANADNKWYTGSYAYDMYEDFCSTNGLSRTASSSLEAFRDNVSPSEFNEIVSILRQANASKSAAADETSLLDKANKALTDLLNNRATAFQETLGPLQEALQAVMYAQQVQYQQQPMQVQHPAGTVDVMPGQEPVAPPPAGGAPGALPAGLVPGDQVPGGMPVPPGQDR